MAKPSSDPGEIPRRPLAKNKKHSEKVIEIVLRDEYKWPRPLVADFLKQLRNA